MKLFVLGLSHKTAPIELRERVAFPEGDEERDAALKKMCSAPAIREGMIISTCNRVELYGIGPSSEDGLAALRSFLTGYHDITAMEVDTHLYRHHGDDAVRHLFRVASSLDSMVIGEPQITGQVKAAYDTAVASGTVGMLLHKVMHRTLQVSKRVRTETAIAQNAVSISYAAVELAKKIFGDLEGRTAMLVGAGKMGELAARNIRSAGIAEVFVTNRTYERAVEVAEGLHGTAVPLDKLARYLELSDIVVFAAAADGYLLDRNGARSVIRARKYRPLFLIDIGVPRVVEPAINQIENIYLYDIDDLRGVVEENLSERMREAERGESIVTEETGEFARALAQLDLAPTIAELNRKLTEICSAELDRTVGNLDSITEEQRTALERMMKSVVKRIAHDPIRTLREGAKAGNGFLYVESLADLFKLELPEPEPDVEPEPEPEPDAEPTPRPEAVADAPTSATAPTEISRSTVAAEAEEDEPRGR